MNEEFEVGDYVIKGTGYSYSGIVVGKYYTLTNKLRYVVELGYTPLQHIFSPLQLRAASIEDVKVIKTLIINR